MFKFVLDYWDKNTWENILVETFSYNVNQNLVEISSESRDHTLDRISKITRTLFDYDNDGNQASRITQEFINSSWQNGNRTRLTYNPNNNVILKLGDFWSDSSWINLYEHEYYYNSDNNISTEIITNTPGTSSKISFNYTEKGILYHAYSEIFNDTSWQIGDHRISFTDSYERNYSFYGSEINVFYSTITNVEEPNLVIDNFSLSQNYPNPFNPKTKIKYSIPNLETRHSSSLQNVKLKIYDILGREVATLVNEQQHPGKYEVIFNASHLTSGTYFYRLTIGEFSETKKIILLK